MAELARVLSDTYQHQEATRAVFDREKRLYDDTTTWLSEVLDGQMRTEFDYQFDGRELYGRDGCPLKGIFKDALKDAQKLAITKPNLAFELRRRWVEQGEYQDMIRMAKGELPDTMVVVSDFPEELMDSPTDVGGYNTRRKQTMLRVITRRIDGTLAMCSQSLDGSNRAGLEAIYRHLGFEPEAGELLGQRMYLDLPSDQRTYLTDCLMGVYDKSLTEQEGGEWYAGRRPADYLNTYDFVCSQTDLLNAYCLQPDDVLLYGLAAALEDRLRQHRQPNSPGSVLYARSVETINYALLEMQGAGAEAKIANKTYSGCGATLFGSPNTTQDELKEAGYGNKTTDQIDYKFDQEMHCRKCQPTPKKEDPKKMCGPCGICKSCDLKIRAKNRPNQ